MSLTVLKQKIFALYDSFTNDTIDAFKIAEVKNLLWVLKPLNRIGREQIDILWEFFGRDVEERATGGKWNLEHLLERKANIDSALDIVFELGCVA
ncbi:MAG: hypothetical protein IT393_03765 [Nitrospirae bacterium]|nr:hypothetical protein [Nitrospirota bacterium]